MSKKQLRADTLLAIQQSSPTLTILENDCNLLLDLAEEGIIKVDNESGKIIIKTTPGEKNDNYGKRVIEAQRQLKRNKII